MQLSYFLVYVIIILQILSKNSILEENKQFAYICIERYISLQSPFVQTL